MGPPTSPPADPLPVGGDREAGTLLELVWKLAGDEARVREVLRAGYALTGSFRGRESELLAEPR
jgi:hypothetical protein